MYGFFKDLRFKIGWFLLKKAHPLRYLFFEVTRQCNLNCLYCGSHCSTQIQKAELTTSQWIEAIQQIARDFNAPNIMVGITGGEAFMRPDLFEIMEELKRYGFHFGVINNGVLINEDVAKKLVQVKINTITLSLDGPTELNDALRGKQSFHGVKQAIENLRKAGFKGKLEIFSSITTKTLLALTEFQKLLMAWNIRHWRIAPVFSLGRAKQHQHLILDKEGLRTLLDFIYQARQNKNLPVPEMCEEGTLPPPYEECVRPHVSQCRSGITVGSILCDGSIAACPELGPEFIQGNILHDRFLDVWNRKYQIFRNRRWLKNKGICKGCQHFSRCLGGGLHLYDPELQTISRCYWQLKDQRNESDRPFIDEKAIIT